MKRRCIPGVTERAGDGKSAEDAAEENVAAELLNALLLDGVGGLVGRGEDSDLVLALVAELVREERRDY